MMNILCNLRGMKCLLQRCVQSSSRLFREQQTQVITRYSSSSTSFPQPPSLDLEYLCSDSNAREIEANIRHRKGVGDLSKVRQLHSKWSLESNDEKRHRLYLELVAEASQIPNSTHPETPIGDEDCAVTMATVGQPRRFDFKPRGVVDLGESLGHLRCYNTTMTTGPRTYYFMDSFARLESALVKYTLTKALENGFQLVSVPDIVQDTVIESAGFKTTGERTQVYKLKGDVNANGPRLCLAGSAEMPLIGFLTNKLLDAENLPLKLVAASRCFRAETSTVGEETGIYRVHQFTKVELFGVTANDEGDEGQRLFDEILRLQKELFTSLGLYFRVLNMPTQELGHPAYCKYDVEAWMPRKLFWGEISSTSNCTDFQSRRMNLTYGPATDTDSNDGRYRFCQTVNGTGCAVPRALMAIVENYQNQDGSITVPHVLRPYMKGEERIVMSGRTTRPRWIRSKKH